MRYSQIENIWTVELSGLPKVQIGQIYLERARAVLSDCFKRGTLVQDRGRVSRRWLCDRIGCRPQALTQNRALRALITDADDLLRRKPDTPAVAQGNADSRAEILLLERKVRELEAIIGDLQARNPTLRNHPEAPDETFRGRRSGMRGTMRAVTFELNGTPYKSYELYWKRRLHEPTTDWLRWLAVVEGAATTSLRFYAIALRQFLDAAFRRQLDWAHVNDDFLREYRDEALRSARPNRVKDVLDVTFAFYRWAETTGRLNFHVGIYDRLSLPTELLTANYQFPISAHASYDHRRKRLVWGLTIKVKGRSKNPTRHTPTAAETARLHLLAGDHRQGERNSLALSIAEKTGGRRSEVLAVRCKQLPTSEKIDELYETNALWAVRVPRKGQRTGFLLFDADLCSAALDYIANDRKRIVSLYASADPKYREPAELLLSESGQVLKPDSLSAIGTDLFRRAGIKNSNYHRLRSRFIVLMIDSEIGAYLSMFPGAGYGTNFIETILTRAAQRMDHISIESLRPYVIDRFDVRIQVDRKTRSQNAEARRRELTKYQSAIKSRLEKIENLAGSTVDVEMLRSEAANLLAVAFAISE